jgi:diguanylate cyclase (GGDEF)-like protein
MDEASSGGTPGREHSGIAARLSAESEEPSDVVEMKGFNRTLAEIEWLLLVLILVYMTLPDEKVQHPLHILGAGGLFALFVVGFRYANLLALPSRWKFTIETWAMIALTAVAVWNTGKVDSPLLNLFLLVVIFSAITLGRLVTLLELCLIASFYLLSAYAMEGVDMFRYEIFSYLMLNFAPFVLVAYVTSLLAADLGAARAHAEQLAGTDELTGLSNIRAFKNALSRYERAAHKGNEPLSILMIDIDKLKRVNDQYGHEIGNAVIRTVATAIRQSVRAEDFVARHGGDEFAVLLPSAAEDAARRAAERVLKRTAERPIETPIASIGVSVSIGIATLPDTATEVEGLLQNADLALYASKRGGRNRLSVYPHLQPTQKPAPIEPA